MLEKKFEPLSECLYCLVNATPNIISSLGIQSTLKLTLSPSQYSFAVKPGMALGLKNQPGDKGSLV